MAFSVTINAISRPAGAAGPIQVTYTGSAGGAGQGIGWDSPAMLDMALAYGVINVNSELGCLLIYLSWWKARSADYSNTSLVVNKTMTVDLSAASPIKVQ